MCLSTTSISSLSQVAAKCSANSCYNLVAFSSPSFQEHNICSLPSFKFTTLLHRHRTNTLLLAKSMFTSQISNILQAVKPIFPLEKIWLKIWSPIFECEITKKVWWYNFVQMLRYLYANFSVTHKSNIRPLGAISTSAPPHETTLVTREERKKEKVWKCRSRWKFRWIAWGVTEA